MTISALANAAAARREDLVPLGTVPDGIGQIAQAASTPPTTTPPAGGRAPTGSGQIDTALNVLFGYIPVEVLTLYVAVLAAIHQTDKVTSAEWAAFWAFLVVTPVVEWAAYAAKTKVPEKHLPLRPRYWPRWEMSAATVAYLAWAFALPNSPFVAYGWYSSALGGVAVLVASSFLGLAAPFFQRPLTAPSDV